jgi:DNA invertase Pin-like site-specific DNA recombinase
MESRVGFISVDIPEANHFILHILAAVAEYQREEISSTTKSALQAAKRRGVKLGKNGATLAIENKKKSLEFVNKTKPMIKKIIDEGFVTIQAITNQLNQRKIQPFRKSSKWHKSTVHKLLKNDSINQVTKK